VFRAILCRIRDKARYWSKITIFPMPLHSMAPLGGPRRNIAITFHMEKLEWLVYETVEKFETRFNTIHEREGLNPYHTTDSRTEIESLFIQRNNINIIIMNTDLPTLVNCKAGHSPDFPCSLRYPSPPHPSLLTCPFPHPLFSFPFPFLSFPCSIPSFISS